MMTFCVAGSTGTGAGKKTRTTVSLPSYVLPGAVKLPAQSLIDLDSERLRIRSDDGLRARRHLYPKTDVTQTAVVSKDRR